MKIIGFRRSENGRAFNWGGESTIIGVQVDIGSFFLYFLGCAEVQYGYKQPVDVVLWEMLFIILCRTKRLVIEANVVNNNNVLNRL